MVLHNVCTWPGNEANGLQCSGLFVARDRKLERRQRLKRVNPLPGGTMGATVSKIIQTITAILVCHCVSVCFFKQPISYRVVRVYYFASTPSLKILVSSKANVTLPVLQNLATRAFKDCLIASGWSNTGGGGGTSMRLAMRRPLLCETTRGTIVRICVTVTQCHTLWHNDKWGPVSMSHSVILWQVGDISQSWDIVGGTGAYKKNEWEGSVKMCIFSVRSILKHYKFACTHPKCTKQGGPGTQLAQLCHFEAIMIVTSC